MPVSHPRERTGKMEISPLIISVCALLFTIGSFWWQNVRTGKLLVTGPRSYVVVAEVPDARPLIIKLPFVFCNTGAAYIVIENLRLVIQSQAGDQRPLKFVATLERLEDTQRRTFATQFPIRGREATKVFCEFQRDPGLLVFDARTYAMKLEGQLLNKGTKWIDLCSFPINIPSEAVPLINTGGRHTVFDNKSEIS